jgi:hypothetical protein
LEIVHLAEDADDSIAATQDGEWHVAVDPGLRLDLAVNGVASESAVRAEAVEVLGMKIEAGEVEVDVRLGVIDRAGLSVRAF